MYTFLNPPRLVHIVGRNLCLKVPTTTNKGGMLKHINGDSVDLIKSKLCCSIFVTSLFVICLRKIAC